jgi:predicted GNAT family acetyltransferase
MKVISYKDHQMFSRDCSRLLSASQQLELENNLSLGLLERINSNEYKDPLMVLVKDEKDDVIFSSLMTVPYNLVLAQGEPRALPLYCDYLIENQIDFPGIIGPEQISDAFSEQWNLQSHNQLSSSLELIFYAVTDNELSSPAHVPGQLRIAQLDDLSLLLDWMYHFAVDAELNEHEQKQDPDKLARRISQGLYFIWEVNNTPVSISSYVPVTKNGVRVGSVYTPSAERGKGYASACVANLARYLFNRKKEWVSLFADSNNPISNGIYKKIGFSYRCTYKDFRVQKA